MVNILVMKGVKQMRRYEQVLEMIEKLEAEEARLENPIEDAYDDMMKNWDIMSNRNRCKAYYDKLMEQNKEINIRIKNHIHSLKFVDHNEEVVAEISDDGDLWARCIESQDLPRYTLWLMAMNEEVA